MAVFGIKFSQYQPISRAPAMVNSKDTWELYSIIYRCNGSGVVEYIADPVAYCDVFVWGKPKVQEQGWRLMGGGSSILPQQHRW